MIHLLLLLAATVQAAPNPYFPAYPNIFVTTETFQQPLHAGQINWADGTISTSASGGGGGFVPTLCTLPQVSLGNSCAQPTNVTGTAATIIGNIQTYQVDLSTIIFKIITPSNSTLGAGTTFYSFTAETNIRLTSMSVILNNPGEDNGITEWRCGGSNYFSVVTDSGTPIGGPQITTGSVSFSSGQTISCLIYTSAQPITPTGAIELAYMRD